MRARLVLPTPDIPKIVTAFAGQSMKALAEGNFISGGRLSNGVFDQAQYRCIPVTGRERTSRNRAWLTPGFQPGDWCVGDPSPASVLAEGRHVSQILVRKRRGRLPLCSAAFLVQCRSAIASSRVFPLAVTNQ